MRLTDILTEEGRPYYNAIRSLYEEAFPEEEKKSFERMEELAYQGKMELLALCKEEELLGLVFYLITEKTALLDYFAILPEKRSMGYGGKAVAAVLERFSDRKLIFEIEKQDPLAENPGDRKRRKAFYLRNGLKETGLFANVYHTDFELLTPDGELDFDTYVTALRESMGEETVRDHSSRAFEKSHAAEKAGSEGKSGFEGVLDSCQVVRIAVWDQEGPYLVPVNFGYSWEEETELQIYLHSAKRGAESCGFRCPEVGFEMDCDHQLIRGDYTCDYSYGYSSITGKGRITLVEEEKEKEEGLRRIACQVGAEVKFLPEMMEKVNVYRLDAAWFSGKNRPVKKDRWKKVMEREIDLAQISDGRRYGLNDLVRADCAGCQGCFSCCCGMEDTILLDPYDMHRMAGGLQKTFDQLLEEQKIRGSLFWRADSSPY